MSKEIVCGIYCIENLVNGKKYIGQSRDIYARWSQHRSELNLNKHHNDRLQNSWNKYKEINFKFYIIEKCKKEDLDNKEVKYILKYNTFAYSNRKMSMGYNLTTGGGSQGDFNEEKRQIYREAQSSKPVYQINTNGNIINKWEYGAREASKKLNIEQSCIWNCVNKNRKTYKGFIWILVEEYNEITFNINEFINVGTQPKRVIQYDMNGKYLKTWDCINKIDGFDPSSISKVCKKKYKSHKNFIWRYENDKDEISEFVKDFCVKNYICAYDDKYNLLYKSKTQRGMAKFLNISESTLSGILNNRFKNNTKIIFKFSYE